MASMPALARPLSSVGRISHQNRGRAKKCVDREPRSRGGEECGNGITYECIGELGRDARDPVCEVKNMFAGKFFRTLIDRYIICVIDMLGTFI